MFCPKLKISITTETIEFSFLGKLYICPEMVLGILIFRLSLKEVLIGPGKVYNFFRRGCLHPPRDFS